MAAPTSAWLLGANEGLLPWLKGGLPVSTQTHTEPLCKRSDQSSRTCRAQSRGRLESGVPSGPSLLLLWPGPPRLPPPPGHTCRGEQQHFQRTSRDLRRATESCSRSTWPGLRPGAPRGDERPRGGPGCWPPLQQPIPGRCRPETPTGCLPSPPALEGCLVKRLLLGCWERWHSWAMGGEFVGASGLSHTHRRTATPPHLAGCSLPLCTVGSKGSKGSKGWRCREKPFSGAASQGWGSREGSKP